MDERRVIHTGSIPDLVTRSIAENPNARSLIDIGTGKGRLLTRLSEIRPDLEVVTVEKDQDLAVLMRIEFPGLEVIGEDFSRVVTERRFDVVAVINTCHEICNSSDENQRELQFEEFVKRAKRIMNPGGSIIFYDGIMPVDRNRKILLTTLTEEGQDSVAFFNQTYLAKPTSFNELSPGVYEAALEDIVIFLTKFAYLAHPNWKGEATQLYPFLSLDKIIDILKQNGFEIRTLAHPAIRNGLSAFLKHFSLEGLEEFPPTQVFIEATIPNPKPIDLLS